MKILLALVTVLTTSYSFSSEFCYSDYDSIKCGIYTGEGVYGAIAGSEVSCVRHIDYRNANTGEQATSQFIHASRSITEDMSRKEIRKLKREAKKEVKAQFKEILATHSECE